jgi:DNA-binding response OmpR family regulator
VIRVLVIDTESENAHSVAKALEGEKMVPTIVHNRDEALWHLCTAPPDAVVLAAGPTADLNEEICRAVCERSFAPVLVVGKREQDLVVERVLAAGADAHVLEPCASEVFVAQLWALLRRVGLVRSALAV